MTKTGHQASPVPVMSSPGAGRLGWLDALRGLAALTVAFHHGTARFTPSFHKDMLAWFDPGLAGVLVFFLVSGYIIPASLERTGSFRRFWISRAFRIYPLLLVALGAVLVLEATALPVLPGGLDAYDPIAVTLSHLTMLQELLAVPNALTVLWTLSYEMAFYLLAVAFFAAGTHRRSSGIALTLAVGAVVLAGVLPSMALATGAGVTPLVLGTGVAVVAAIGLACSRNPAGRRAGALLGGAVAMALLLFNARIPAWQGLIILAVMFTGTALYRAERGQIRRRSAALTAAVVAGTACLLGAMRLSAWNAETTDWAVRRAWISAVLVAAVVFALGYALRHRSMPQALTRLGVISYSVYLLHPVVLVALEKIAGLSASERPLLMIVFFAALLPLAHCTQRLVEAPAQRLGRSLTRRLADRPETPPAPVPQKTPEPALASTRTT
ncbi:acyltransferase family protein [Spirillospora sp. NPDC048911]|uniref:acyltransferase family protein n=1 Tax=Spirillospora sp. NPDC048911 TaxID=3364527 RepID=UPI0037211B3F